jgi:hypothetical protein
MKADRVRQKRYSSTNSAPQHYAKIYFKMMLNIKYAITPTKRLLLSGTALYQWMIRIWKHIIVDYFKGNLGSIQLFSNDTNLKELRAGTNDIVHVCLRNI